MPVEKPMQVQFSLHLRALAFAEHPRRLLNLAGFYAFLYAQYFIFSVLLPA